MSEKAVTSEGWYPHPEKGGTRYWDGKEWTGDWRPPRRKFAAAAAEPELRNLIFLIAVLLVSLLIAAYMREGDIKILVAAILLSVVAGGAVIYLARGRGPSTQQVKTRLLIGTSAPPRRRGVMENLFGFGRRTEQEVQDPSLSNNAAELQLQQLRDLHSAGVLSEAEFAEATERVLRDTSPDE